MLPIASQTARPIGLNFFVDTRKKSIFFSIFFYPWATPGALNYS